MNKQPLVFTIISVLFFTVGVNAEIYQCELSEGITMFSDTPCSQNAKAIEVNVVQSSGFSSGDNNQEASEENKKVMAGNWSTGIHRYQFKPGGKLRDEQYYGGKLIVWRTGTWAYKDNTLTLKFTNSGGSIGNKKLNVTQAGNVNWADDNKSFEVRFGGMLENFYRTKQ